jgi:endonuclease/exonuclease/phosphatase family metal-dependent hydrolase
MRVVSWNIHGCVGSDRRFDPERVARVLARLQPEVVLLQEVGEAHGRQSQVDQAQLLSRQLGMICAVGITVEAGPFGYGLATLCRGPILEADTYDLSVRGYEPRACLRIITGFGMARLTVLNAHLGLAWGERRRQLDRMLGADGPLGRPPAPFVLAGDFNDWPPGPVTRMLGRRLVDAGAGRGRTFPSLLPAVRLDRIYSGRGLRVVLCIVVRTREARLASDHLPVCADLALVGEEVESFLDQPAARTSAGYESSSSGAAPVPPVVFSRSRVR